MKIKHLLTKTLLVAAGLLVGQSVWADNLSAPVKMTYINGSDADVSYGEVTTAYCGYNKISGGKVEMANKAWNVNNIAYLQVDASAVPAGATITAASLEVDCQQISARGLGYGVGYNSSAWSSTITWNTADRSITTLGGVISGSKTTTDKHNTFDITAAFSGDADNIVTILVYQTAAGGGYVTNPTATITYTTETTYNVTFTETNSVTATVKIGETDVTSGTKLANGTYDFTATAAGYQNYAGSFTVSGADKEVTFTMTPKTVYNYTVKAVDGSDNDLGTVASGSGYANEEVTYYYPEFVLSGTTLYTKNGNGSNPYWGASGTLDSDNKEFTVTYGNGTIENVVFYKEAEEIDGFTAKTTNNAPIRCSAGTGGISTDPVALTTLPAGKYTIFGQVWGTTGLTATVKAGDVTVWEQASTGSLVSSTSAEFNLIESTDLTVVTTGGNDNHMLDLIYIVRTGDATTSIPVDIKADGSTFSSAYPIDCDKLPAGVKAYKVTKMTASEVTASEVTGQVAANTGLILKADVAKSYDIPVVASGAAVDGNLLKAAVAATEVAADETYGLKDGKFHKLNAGTIPAGKAYLLASDITSAPELSIVFEGNLTGISVTSATSKNEGVVYDLQGRKVANPTKGLYIQNGRKVILK